MSTITPTVYDPETTPVDPRPLTTLINRIEALRLEPYGSPKYWSNSLEASQVEAEIEERSERLLTLRLSGDTKASDEAITYLLWRVKNTPKAYTRDE